MHLHNLGVDYRVFDKLSYLQIFPYHNHHAEYQRVQSNNNIQGFQDLQHIRKTFQIRQGYACSTIFLFCC